MGNKKQDDNINELVKSLKNKVVYRINHFGEKENGTIDDLYFDVTVFYGGLLSLNIEFYKKNYNKIDNILITRHNTDEQYTCNKYKEYQEFLAFIKENNLTPKIEYIDYSFFEKVRKIHGCRGCSWPTTGAYSVEYCVDKYKDGLVHIHGFSTDMIGYDNDIFYKNKKHCHPVKSEFRRLNELIDSGTITNL